MNAQRVAFPEFHHERLLWFDAADAATLRTSGTFVKSWISKGSRNITAVSASFAPVATLEERNTPQGQWRNAVVSRTGKTCVAFSDVGGPTWISNDFGKTFREVREMSFFRQVYMEAAMSAAGDIIAVCLFDGPLMVSRDSGRTWVEHDIAETGLWEWCSISDDGQYLLASAQSDGVFQSRDGGNTFRKLGMDPLQTELGFVYVSPDGESQYIAYYDGPLSLSSNRGKTFVDHPSMLRGRWGDIAVQKDAQGTPSHQLIYEVPGMLYVTNDAAGTWQERLSDASRMFVAAGISADGSTMVVAEDNGYVYVSKDFGRSFAVLSDLGQRPWSAVHVSMDGSTIVAGNGTPIFSSDESGQVWEEGPSAGLAQEVSLSGISASWDGRVLMIAPAEGQIQVSGESREARLQDAAGVLLSSANVITFPSPLLSRSFTVLAAVLLLDPTVDSGPLLSMGGEILFYPQFAGKVALVRGESPPGEALPGDVVSGKAPLGLRKGAVILAVSVTESAGYHDVTVRVNDMEVISGRFTANAGFTGLPWAMGSYDGSGFRGTVGEMLVFDGDVASDGAAWAAAMYYMGRKWHVPAAIPYLPGIGSDPHIKTMTGGSFDVTRTGVYDLFRCKPGFCISAKISPLKGGLFIEHVRVENGDVSVKVTMKTRCVKFSGKTATGKATGNLLFPDDACPVVWDVYPQSPARLVKIISGYHETVGRFHLRFDFNLRYLTPCFPDFNRWHLAEGILVRGNIGKTTRASVREATFKGVLRPLKRM
jgi:hypothetical protein